MSDEKYEIERERERGGAPICGSYSGICQGERNPNPMHSLFFVEPLLMLAVG